MAATDKRKQHTTVLVGGRLMVRDILHELDALISEISDPIQLRTLDRIVNEVKRLQKIIDDHEHNLLLMERQILFEE